MKRKSLTWLLCTAMTALLLAGCGNSAETMDSGQTAQESKTAEENKGEDSKQAEPAADANAADGELPTITFVHGYYHDESEWRQPLRCVRSTRNLRMLTKMNSIL